MGNTKYLGVTKEEFIRWRNNNTSAKISLEQPFMCTHMFTNLLFSEYGRITDLDRKLFFYLTDRMKRDSLGMVELTEANTEIARRIGVSAGSITRSLKRLLAAEAIYAHPKGPRAYVVNFEMCFYVPPELIRALEGGSIDEGQAYQAAFDLAHQARIDSGIATDRIFKLHRAPEGLGREQEDEEAQVDEISRDQPLVYMAKNFYKLLNGDFGKITLLEKELFMYVCDRLEDDLTGVAKVTEDNEEIARELGVYAGDVERSFELLIAAGALARLPRHQRWFEVSPELCIRIPDAMLDMLERGEIELADAVRISYAMMLEAKGVTKQAFVQ